MELNRPKVKSDMHLHCADHAKKLLGACERFFASESQVDVTLAAEGRSLKAHRLVLSASSPFFEELLTCPENGRDKYPIIFLNGVKFKELETLIEYMYKGVITVPQKELEALLRVAESLKIRGLGVSSDMDEDCNSNNSSSLSLSRRSSQQQRTDPLGLLRSPNPTVNEPISSHGRPPSAHGGSSGGSGGGGGSLHPDFSRRLSRHSSSPLPFPGGSGPDGRISPFAGSSPYHGMGLNRTSPMPNPNRLSPIPQPRLNSSPTHTHTLTVPNLFSSMMALQMLASPDRNLSIPPNHDGNSLAPPGGNYPGSSSRSPCRSPGLIGSPLSPNLLMSLQGSRSPGIPGAPNPTFTFGRSPYGGHSPIPPHRTTSLEVPHNPEVPPDFSTPRFDLVRKTEPSNFGSPLPLSHEDRASTFASRLSSAVNISARLKKRGVQRLRIHPNQKSLRQSYLRHVLDSRGMFPFKCTTCSKLYKSAGSLKRHKKYECNVAPQFRCSYCGQFTRYSSDLKKHEKSCKVLQSELVSPSNPACTSMDRDRDSTNNNNNNDNNPSNLTVNESANVARSQ